MRRDESRQAAAAVTAPRLGLGRVFARNVRDNVIAELATQLVRVTTMVLLARRLDPNDFGVFRVLLVLCVVVGLINQAGIPEALIQRSELRAAHESVAWWINLGLAASSGSALYAGGALVARFMVMPELAKGMRLLCIPLIIEGSVGTAKARLQRELRFGFLALADILAEVVFMGTALWVLHAGRPVDSLPAALAARFAVHGLTIWIAAGQLPRALPQMSTARDFARFAGAAASAQIVCFLSNNADYLLVGRLLGGTALGYYSIAWDLLRFIPDRLHQVAGRVAFPTFCRLQNDDRRFGEAYLKFFGYTAKIVLPLVACLLAAAPEVLDALYGPKWLAAATLLRFLGSGLALAGLTVGIGSVYYAKNRPALDLYLHSARFLLLTIACVTFAPLGIRGVSAAMGVEEAVIGITGCWLVGRLIGLTLKNLARAAAPGILLAMACAVATLAGKTVASMTGVGTVATLLLIFSAPAAVFLWSEAANVIEMARNAFGVIGGVPSDSAVG